MADWDAYLALAKDTVQAHPIVLAAAALGLATVLIVIAFVVCGKRSDKYQRMHDEEAGGRKGARSPVKAKSKTGPVAMDVSARAAPVKKKEDERAVAAAKEQESIAAERENAEAELARLREKAKSGQLSAEEQAMLEKAEEKAMELQIAEMDKKAKLAALRKDVVEQELAKYRRDAIKRLAAFKEAKDQRDTMRLARGEILPGEFLEVHSPVKDSLPQFANLAPGVVLATTPTAMDLKQTSAAPPPNAPPTSSGYAVSYVNSYPLGAQKVQPTSAIVSARKASSSGGWFGFSSRK